MQYEIETYWFAMGEQFYSGEFEKMTDCVYQLVLICKCSGEDVWPSPWLLEATRLLCDFEMVRVVVDNVRHNEGVTLHVEI